MKTKKTVKKAAPKKAAKKAAAKKPVVKKAAPKKAAKKAAPKKSTVKKATPAKKAAPKKKVVKKAAPKKGKKAAKKTAARVKKSSKKIVTTTTVVTTTTTTIAPEATETHYLLILDESGSMESTRQTTLDGLNEQIQAINKLETQYPDHKYFINILKFDNDFRDLVINVPVSKVKKFTFEDYAPNGSTALRDAIGYGVNRLNEQIESKVKAGEAKALVIILTDGEENASLKFSPIQIKELITKLDETQMWTFTFIGANQDSVTTAGSYGIHASNVANYNSSLKGTSTAFAAITGGMSNRASGYNTFASGGYSNRAFMSSVLQDSVNIGEDASLLNVVDTNINTATGISNTTTTGAKIPNTPVDTSNSKTTPVDNNSTK